MRRESIIGRRKSDGKPLLAGIRPTHSKKISEAEGYEQMKSFIFEWALEIGGWVSKWGVGGKTTPQ